MFILRNADALRVIIRARSRSIKHVSVVINELNAVAAIDVPQLVIELAAIVPIELSIAVIPLRTDLIKNKNKKHKKFQQ
jgi:hypothetical protein